MDTVPRAGAAWDLMGNGKTVLKGSFGLFGDTMGDLYANNFNPNAQATQTYAWTGPCVVTAFKNDTFNNTSCDVTPDFLATLPSRTPLSATGGINSVVNPDLKQNKTYEYTARLERQLMPNVALSVGYVYHKITNNYNNVQYLRPFDTWVPATPATPFLDQNGVPVTIYTYPASEVGAAFNVLKAANATSDNADVFHSFEIAATKRFSKRWTGTASYWTTKNHQYLVSTTAGNGSTPNSPNDTRFAIDDTWNWESRANVSYNLPLDINLSGSYRAQSGQPGQRSQVFTAPATVLRQGSVTLRMGPYGEFRTEAVQIVALKASKNFAIGQGRRVELNFQVFNAFNSSAATSTNYQTGTQFGTVTGITSARVARVGAAFVF
jgi:hypothetical protein